MRTLADTVRKLRKLRGWTQEELGEQAEGLDKQTINRIENGKNVTMNSLVKIAKALEVPPEHLMPTFREVVEEEADKSRAKRRDPVRHGRDLESGRPQDVGGPLDVPASARVLALLQDLVAAIAQQEASTGKMRELANKLLDVAAAGAEGDSIADETPASSDRDRKTD